MPYPITPVPGGQTPPADPQADTQLRYKRFLERLAGFAPGESDLTDEEILRRRGEAAGPDDLPGGAPMPGSMQVSVPGSVPGPGGDPIHLALAQLYAQPGMMEHLEGIDLDGDGIPDLPTPPHPADTQARMHWAALANQRDNLIQNAQQRRVVRRGSQNHVLLNVLQAYDPLFEQTSSRLRMYVNGLPDKVKRVFLTADNIAPGTFLQLYLHLRDSLKTTGAGGKPGKTAPPSAASDEDPRARIRRAGSGRMAAPALENPGMHDDMPVTAARNGELAALKARARSGQAREGDLLRYLELSMNNGSGR